MENWKTIENYPNYQISDSGNIISLKKNKYLKPKVDKYGYSVVQLYNDDGAKPFTVHSLVGKAFIPNPDNLPCLNHRNENKLDNSAENLEWCTHKYNNNYGTRNERIGKALSKKVYQYDLAGHFIKEWASSMDCERNGFDHRKITLCCNGKRNKHKGYIWKHTMI